MIKTKFGNASLRNGRYYVYKKINVKKSDVGGLII